MDILLFLTLVTVGFTACAEFGSWAFVHPVVRSLPQKEFILFEKGLLKTFGRVMPPLMVISTILAITIAIKGYGQAATLLLILGAGSIVIAVISTVIFNVPINNATGKWNIDNPPEDWKATRNKWEFYQGVRSLLLLVGFVLICAAASSL